MKPALLSLLVIAKLAAVTGAALAAMPYTEIRLEPAPTGAFALTEPLSGGYRRKGGSMDARG